MTAFLDADGVLIDFDQAAYDVHGHVGPRPTCWDFYKEWNPPLTDDAFWTPIRKLGTDFYKIAKPYSWTAELIRLVQSYTKDVVILTANHGTPEGFAGKKWWLNEYVPGIPTMIVDHKIHKALVARYDRVLIDDKNETITEFHEHGGCGILFPQPWNRVADAACCAESRLEYVAGLLDFYSRRASHVGGFQK